MNRNSQNTKAGVSIGCDPLYKQLHYQPMYVFDLSLEIIMLLWSRLSLSTRIGLGSAPALVTRIRKPTRGFDSLIDLDTLLGMIHMRRVLPIQTCFLHAVATTKLNTPLNVEKVSGYTPVSPAWKKDENASESPDTPTSFVLDSLQLRIECKQLDCADFLLQGHPLS